MSKRKIKKHKQFLTEEYDIHSIDDIHYNLRDKLYCNVQFYEDSISARLDKKLTDKLYTPLSRYMDEYFFQDNYPFYDDEET